jgi:hypothetical protein
MHYGKQPGLKCERGYSAPIQTHLYQLQKLMDCPKQIFPLVPKIAGSNQAEAIGFSRPKLSSLANRGLRSARAVRGSPARERAARSEWFGALHERQPHTRSGSGPPCGKPRARSVWMPPEMTEEYKHTRRTMGRAT